MLISKFDLYKTEWLDLVFENRNKAYGAYELRQHNDRTIARAMGVTFFIVGVLSAVSIIAHKVPVHGPAVIHVTIQPPLIIAHEKKIIPPQIRPIKPVMPVHPPATKQFIEMRVVADNLAKEPVKIVELEHVAIGPKTVAGPAATEPLIPVEVQSEGNAIEAPDNTIHSFVDVMPEPVGGAAAWTKFLNKTLRFPSVAQEDGVSGRVIMSFVIEKDGSLTDITVEGPAGHGFDEEALRVLKLAKAWKPGVQNGKPVRVKYAIPINFQITSDN